MAEIEIMRFPRIVTTNSQDNSNIQNLNEISIANVTFDFGEGTEAHYLSICGAIKEDELETFYIMDELHTNDVIKVPLYKGNYVLGLGLGFSATKIEGKAEEIDTGVILISGDCKLTLSENNS